MSITDNEEYKKEKRKRFGGPIGASMSAMDMNDARKEAFEKGVEWCEKQLTAQHDKEMEEFYNWLNSKSLESNGDMHVIENGNWLGFKPFSEIIELFRNRNK